MGLFKYVFVIVVVQFEEMEELRKQGLMQMIVLKKSNRLGHFRCKKARDVTLQVTWVFYQIQYNKRSAKRNCSIRF